MAHHGVIFDVSVKERHSWCLGSPGSPGHYWFRYFPFLKVMMERRAFAHNLRIALQQLDAYHHHT